MHMADALLSPAVSGVLYAGSAGALAWTVKKLDKDEVGEKKLPLMAVSGAFVFAAQMINFSIPGTGSSGHIGGGVLLAGLLGGYPAMLTLAAVLVIQCLFFADGGLLALGANLFNMGVIPCLIVYPLLFRPLVKGNATSRRISLTAVLSAVAALQLGAFAVVLETWASGITELPIAAFAALMQPIHLVIGLVEGILTAGVLTFVHKTRPDLLESSLSGTSPKDSLKGLLALGAVLALLVGGGLSYFASENPDGLEWSVAGTAGVEEFNRQGQAYDAAESIQSRTALLPDYDFRAGEGTGTGTAGVLGAALTCALAGAAGGAVWLIKRRKRQ